MINKSVSPIEAELLTFFKSIQRPLEELDKYRTDADSETMGKKEFAEYMKVNSEKTIKVTNPTIDFFYGSRTGDFFRDNNIAGVIIQPESIRAYESIESLWDNLTIDINIGIRSLIAVPKSRSKKLIWAEPHTGSPLLHILHPDYNPLSVSGPSAPKKGGIPLPGKLEHTNIGPSPETNSKYLHDKKMGPGKNGKYN